MRIYEKPIQPNLDLESLQISVLHVNPEIDAQGTAHALVKQLFDHQLPVIVVLLAIANFVESYLQRPL